MVGLDDDDGPSVEVAEVPQSVGVAGHDVRQGQVEAFELLDFYDGPGDRAPAVVVERVEVGPNRGASDEGLLCLELPRSSLRE